MKLQLQGVTNLVVPDTASFDNGHVRLLVAGVTRRIEGTTRIVRIVAWQEDPVCHRCGEPV